MWVGLPAQSRRLGQRTVHVPVAPPGRPCGALAGLRMASGNEWMQPAGGQGSALSCTVGTVWTAASHVVCRGSGTPQRCRECCQCVCSHVGSAWEAAFPGRAGGAEVWKSDRKQNTAAHALDRRGDFWPPPRAWCLTGTDKLHACRARRASVRWRALAALATATWCHTSCAVSGLSGAAQHGHTWRMVRWRWTTCWMQVTWTSAPQHGM